MNENITPVNTTSNKMMLKINPAVSLGPGDSGTTLELTSTESDEVAQPVSGGGIWSVSYTHLTLPTTPYV